MIFIIIAASADRLKKPVVSTDQESRQEIHYVLKMAPGQINSSLPAVIELAQAKLEHLIAVEY